MFLLFLFNSILAYFASAISITLSFSLAIEITNRQVNLFSPKYSKMTKLPMIIKSIEDSLYTLSLDLFKRLCIQQVFC
jgi:hypothetical protein